MNQAELALPSQEPQHEDSTGFRIGWDHAHHGLVPPPELLLEGTPIGQGWRAARAVFSARGRSWPANRHTRRWLALRIDAWRARVPFDLTTVTPNHLAQIEVRSCPVRRVPLGGAGDGPDAADALQVARLNTQAAYAAGNLVTLSRAAALAWQGLDVADLVRQARAGEAAQAMQAMQAVVAMPAIPAAAGTAGSTGTALDAAAWWRLATLRSLATPLPAVEAARLPLAVLPPNRTRLLNTVQALQALLTMRLAGPDWCPRMGAVAALLPSREQRTDFNLWVGALAPRLLEAQVQGRDAACALEDAWLGERVQRRWQVFVSSLGEPACEELVRRLALQRLPGRNAILLPWDQALDGWSLAAPQSCASALNGATATAPRVSGPVPPAPPATRRKAARTPFAPRPRATAGPRPAAR